MTDEEFSRAARTYGDTLYRVAYHALQNRADAEDVMQTVLLRLYEHRREFESEDHLKHWLLRVAVNESRKVLRTRHDAVATQETRTHSELHGHPLAPASEVPMVKNSRLTTLHRPFVGLGTRRTGKSPGKFWARESGRPKDVVKPELLTTGNVPLGHRAR